MIKMKHKGVDILSIDAKDIYLTNNYLDDDSGIGFNIRDKYDNVNTKKFINTLDYSLDLIKLREVYYKTYRNNRFSFKQNGHEYSKSVINVTFKYSVKEFNKINKNTFVRVGYNTKNIEFTDNVCIKDGKLVAIITDNEVDNDKLISKDLLEKYFTIDTNENKSFYRAKNMSSKVDVKQLRYELYKNGFYCDGVKYVRWKRSSGSARVGKCLFIDEKLYSKMHKWEMAGLNIKEGDKVDLAGIEAYISLPSSSIIDLLELQPENILLIDDYKSSFEEDVINTYLDDDNFVKSEPARVTIKNSIWDGQSLMDVSVFEDNGYSDKGMLLLRNKFFKSCCFNTNIQKWFADNGITEISQLNGQTRATSIDQIKLITTPSSIKYMKYSTFDAWLNNIDELFGIVKYDKPTHYFDGKLVQCHYQLLNTLQMNETDVKEFLKPTFEYLDKLKSDVAVVRSHVKYEKELELTADNFSYVSKNDIVYSMLALNDDFQYTRMYHQFVNEIVKSFISNARQGHIYIHGNYSTLCGNPVEMLQQSIGTFKGNSLIGKGNIYNTNFGFGQVLLGSRSPHISMCNVWTPTNTDNEMIRTYMNPSNQIVYINSIGESTLDILSGADFDSDTVMLTDDSVLIRCALKNKGKFKISTNSVPSETRARYYCAEDKCDLDIKTGNNKIGEIVNVSMVLNTILWEKINKGANFEDTDVQNIYCDICTLNVLSNLEIDSAKKEFVVSTFKELQKLRKKYRNVNIDGRAIKPNFIAHISRLKGYYDNTKNYYKIHNIGMDIIQTEFRCYTRRNPYVKTDKSNKKLKPISYVIDRGKYNEWNVTDTQINRILENLDALNNYRMYLFCNQIDDSFELFKIAKEEVVSLINDTPMTINTLIKLMRIVDDMNLFYKNVVMYALFTHKHESMLDAIKVNQDNVYEVVQTDSDSYDMVLYGIKYKYQKIDVSLNL